MLKPRIERIHHLAIAVPSLERALELWRDALGVSPDIREFPEHQMREAAFPVGEVEVRLWQSTNGQSGDGLRQIGLQVSDFDDTVLACRTLGLEPALPGPAAALHGRRRQLTQSAGAGPTFELLEANSLAVPLPSRTPRTVTRTTAKRPAPAPRVRNAKGPTPAKGTTPVKTAGAPRPSVRPRGKVHRGGKK